MQASSADNTLQDATLSSRCTFRTGKGNCHKGCSGVTGWAYQVASAGAAVGNGPGISWEPGVLPGGPSQKHHLASIDVPDRHHIMDIPGGVHEEASRTLARHRQHILTERQLRSRNVQL